MNNITYGNGLAGLDRILGRGFPPENTNGYRLLIRGLPGTGKTTLALHLLHDQLAKARPQPPPGTPGNGLLVYYQESLEELNIVRKQFGLDFQGLRLDKVQWAREDVLLIARDHSGGDARERSFIEKWLDAGQGAAPRCILLDGLSLLKSVDPQHIHRILVDLTSLVRREGLLFIITAEEDIVGSDHFFEHMVDGVINLTMDESPLRHRYLEITKLRYIDFARGRHGFEMHSLPHGDGSSLSIYPTPACHFLRLSEEGLRRDEPANAGIDSGIDGLGEPLRGSDTEQASTGQEGDRPRVLQSGDVFLVTAEPETDKVGMGLRFLNPLAKSNEERGFWVSYGPNSLNDVWDKVPPELRNVVGRRLFEIRRESEAMHPGRILTQLVDQLRLNNCAKGKPTTRVVVDGLASMVRDLGTPEEVLDHTRWLARILRSCNAVSFLFWDLAHTFQALPNIPFVLDDVTDFVGHLRWFEINNHLTQSFTVTKSRYRKYNSVPQWVVFRKDGFALEDRGWPMISMLSGRMDTIHEAKVFLKFFDQNYSTRGIHDPVLQEFHERYSGDMIFSHVFRSSPSPTHWSFRGYAGAGHSNTKVVCLKQYLMDVLDRDEVLIDLPEEEWQKYPLYTELPEQEHIDAHCYSLWGLTHKRRRDPGAAASEHRNMLPLFADMGVLAAQINLGQLADKANNEVEGGVRPDVWYVPEKAPTSWEEMFEQNEKFKAAVAQDRLENSGIRRLPPWIRSLFAMPSLVGNQSEFIAFFLELLLEHSEQDFDALSEELRDKNHRGLRKWVNGDGFRATVRLLRKLVGAGVSSSPLERIHYHTAFFSRRWFSKIDQYPMDDPRLPEIEKYKWPRHDPHFKETELKKRFEFTVHPMPARKGSKESGFSCLEVYSLGVIRGALAPETAWMFMSDLAASRTDISRFEQRRGLPILRENWSAPPENPQRDTDQKALDRILDRHRFFCNFWIPNYWEIESRLGKLMRNIFINIRPPAVGNPADNRWTDEFEPGIDALQKGFENVLEDALKQR